MPTQNRHASRAPAAEGNRKTQKRYEGTRFRGHVLVTVNERELDPRLDLHNHSPNGFEWGYDGSGPAQLSLAILADHLPHPHLALSLYQDFKREIVSGLPHERWSLTTSDIERTLARIQNTREGARS